MTDFDSLLHRYLDDRSCLSLDELDELIAGLRDDPELAARLRDQLLLDELLDQKLAVDRRNFEAQVGQRIADLAKTTGPLGNQVDDLRSLAAAERAPSAQPSASWARLILALSVLLTAGVAWYAISSGMHPPAIATITDVSGQVTIHTGDEASPAEVNGAIENGQKVVVPHGDSISLAYEDGTEIRIKGEACVGFGGEANKGGKLIRVESGELVAKVSLQAAGPVRFHTPHSVAYAPKSQLRLVVTEEHTLLDVSEGNVRFDRIADKRTLTVVSNESGLASRDTLQIRQLTWPDRRDGLAYLYSPLEAASENKPLMMARNPETRRLGFKELQPYGDATLIESRLVYELNGGYLYSSDAGPAVSAYSRNGSELTLEAIFCPASLDQAGPARILSLADEEDDPDFALAQDGGDVTFSLRTNVKQAAASPRLPISLSDTPVHITVTYRHGELLFYRDGMEIARSKDLLGSLAAWRSGPLTVGADASGKNPWRGIMEAFALYNRCLEPGEVARNARNYRLLAGRGM